MGPVEVLEQELRKYESALNHSNISFEKGEIDSDLHESHVVNLEPKIREFRLAIRVLNSYL